MKSKLLFISLFTLITLGLFVSQAQECTFYFPAKEGAKVEITHYSKKGKTTGRAVYEVLEYKNAAAEIEVKSYDANNHEQGSSNMKVQCKDGIFSAEMNNFIAPEMLEAYQNFDVKIESDYLEFPSKIKVGQQLKDGKITITASSPMLPTPMSISTLIKDRKVIGEESITTPAGTFKCYKITYTVESNVIVSTQTNHVTEFITPNIGMVRSEVHDLNGNLKAYSELTSISD